MTTKRVPILEEQVEVSKRVVETGVVRTETLVEERVEDIDVLLAREDVEIHRVSVNRPVDRPVPTRQEGDTTIISLHEQVPVVTTQLVLVEEIHLRLRRSEQQQSQSVVLRRERMDIDRERRDAAGSASSEAAD